MNMADKGLQGDLFNEVTQKKTKPNPLPKIIVMLALAGIIGFFMFYENEPAKIVSIPKATTPAANRAESTASSIIQPAPGSKLKPIVRKPAAPQAQPTVNSAKEATQPPGNSARALITEFKAKKGTTDLKQIVKSAERFKAKGMLADAHLLYFFAAKRGDSSAALVLAKMNDPAHHSQQSSVMDQPDLVQAYKWYQQAARSGKTSHQKDLNDFRTRMEQKAASGDIAAKQLSLQWQ